MSDLQLSSLCLSRCVQGPCCRFKVPYYLLSLLFYLYEHVKHELKVQSNSVKYPVAHCTFHFSNIHVCTLERFI